MNAKPAIDFIHALSYERLPASVVEQAKRCIIDLAATAAAGSKTDLSRIIRTYCAAAFGSTEGGARMMFDGRRISVAGAALAGATTIDSFDAHDGHALTKGHAGVTVLPALLAFADSRNKEMLGREFLTALVMGYEIALRAGIATHRTACDYHTSGSWNALGAAAIGARILGLDADRTRHALGIAEYHGPRSQMMRCIDHPTMVKDGSGWGALGGVVAAELAAAGFTGAPALVVERDDVKDLWTDLGDRWRILEMYFKPYPVCRWAQPAVEAALAVVTEHRLQAGDIAHIEVETFHEAIRLDTRAPRTTEEAQYSLPYPVAAAIARGRLGASEVMGEMLADPAILRLSASMKLSESAEFNARFPAERYARVTIEASRGQRYVSPALSARGDPDSFLTTSELRQKLAELAGSARGNKITHIVESLDHPAVSSATIVNVLSEPL